MRRAILLLVIAYAVPFFANGVGIIDANNGIYLKLLSSSVNTSVDNQVSVTTTIQTFKNTFQQNKHVVYIFPLPEGASATGLEWQINGLWHTAVLAPGSPDTTLPGPGGNIHPNLVQYMGATPLYFTIPDSVYADSTLIVKLTYVQLLKYELGTVFYEYPNDYHLIQTLPLIVQNLNFELTSQRTIDSIKIVSHTPQSINNTGHTASIIVTINEQIADKNYLIEYSLNSSELGLFSMSSFIADTLLPDTVGRGFFTFIAEPDANQTNVINKVFTLIIDRSGSMGWENKMEQAKQAASFIVDHLNAGDKFNLIDFDDIITSFQPGHVPFNEDYRILAQNYISQLEARSATDISGAFGTAVPQFINVNDSTANIIIFLTDGQATAGITNTELLLAYVNSLTSQVDTSLTIFTFGIGSDVNQQLLTLLAAQHNGICEFLMNDEILERISRFYMKIRNPVLINTQVSFNPPILERYPSPLPNLYKGQQLIVSGRYQEPVTTNVTFSGTAFGQPVQYQYQMQLTDSFIVRYMFLTKIWAKLKIENLLVLYYSLDPNSPQAQEVKEQIIWLSINYGVSSPFTNYSGGSTGVEEETDQDKPIVTDFELLGNYPNPFNPSTIINFRVNSGEADFVFIRIYNMLGELIRELKVWINGKGEYKILWDGMNEYGQSVTSGNYIYIVSYASTVLAGKMTLLK